MRAVILSRGEGKTSRAVKWLRGDSRRYLLVPTVAMAEMIRRDHKDLANRILAATEHHDRFRGLHPHAEVGIDELEMVLHVLVGERFGSGAHVSLVTVDEDTLEVQV